MYLSELKRIHLKDINLVTKRQLTLLEKLGILTVYDLLNFFPFRYEDRSTIESIETSLIQKRPVCTLVTVVEHQSIFYNGRKHPKIQVQDSKLRAYLVGFNRQFLFNSMKVGKKYWVFAEFVLKFNEVQTSTFDFEEFVEGQKPKNFGSILPIYSVTEGLSVKELRQIINKLMEKYLGGIDDELPEYLLKAHKLISKTEALKFIHFPQNSQELLKAKFRLAFEELFAIQLVVMMKRKMQTTIPKNFKYNNEVVVREFIAKLPFQLTRAQQNALGEIIRDMKGQKAMHRLLQGDVGSGKTVVAFIAMILAATNGFQSAMMVPTEVLAFQHYKNFLKLTEGLNIKAAILTKSITGRERNIILEGVKNGEIQLLIGTHALLQDDVNFKDLSLIIFDEQHRFGVEQRIIMAKKGNNPDILVMTATPIPRTLSLTLYGDLDISIIDEMPAGRIPVITKWFIKERDYPKLLRFIRQELMKGRQAYFIYPLIEESDKIDFENAIENYKKLSEVFKEYKVGLLHGRMSSDEKIKIMDEFKENKIQLLVSTTVIEVGVDVPNASIMVIEGADRFGLSQLHQLRGRVGRGKFQSYCALVTDGNESYETQRRMEVICNYTDGFKIAEEDLKLRGPGEILGVKQSGMPELKIADFLQDEKLLILARKDAENILNYDPELSLEKHRPLKEGIIRYLPVDYLYSG
ncbi:MAG: ATP-dependent DNA helicase RecG [Brevinematia bacterium]